MGIESTGIEALNGNFVCVSLPTFRRHLKKFASRSTSTPSAFDVISS